jgi:hypothetical protein
MKTNDKTARRIAPPVVPQRSRTTEGLRDMLFDEIELLRQGKTETHRLAVIGRASYQIIASARLELEFAALRSRLLDATGTPVKSVQLGTDETKGTSDVGLE